MTGKLDSRARDTAEAMIAKFGKAMTLRRATVGAYDPSTGAAAEVTADYPIVGVVAQPSPAMFQAGLAVAGDITVLIAAKATSLVPVPGDEIVIDGVTWQATSVRSMFSGELIATYEVMARG